MPTSPKPGQAVNVALSQEVQADGADRFDLQLRTPLPKRGGISEVYLYRIHVYLTYNVATKPLDLGEVLADLPVAPDAGEYYWTKDYAAHPQDILGAVYGPDVPRYKKCAIGNSRTLHSILTLPSKRPAELAEILPQLAY